MDADHPERAKDNGLEATVGDHVRLGQFLNALDRASENELKEIAKTMAHQVFLVHPAAMRYLAREAAANLSGAPWRAEVGERLVAALGAGGDAV